MLIGIIGLATSGKSTVAKILNETHAFHRIAMAAPLKTMLNSLGLTLEQTNGDQKEVPCDLLCGKTPRHAMQTLGTDWGRDLIGPDFWVLAWEAHYRRVKEVVPDIVVDDVRFPNEVHKIRELGGVIVRIVRPGTKQGSHASETHVLPQDYVLINDGSIDELTEEVSDLLCYLRKPG